MHASNLPSPQSKATLWCLLLSLTGGILAVAPFFVGESMGQGRFALVLIGALIGLTALAVIPYFRNRTRVATELLDETKLLAHWTLTEGEWTAWMQLDEAAERRSKWKLFGVVAFFCVVIGGGFAWADPDAGFVVLGVLLGLCMVIAVIIPWSLRYTRARRLTAAREVRISTNGLSLGSELHIWHGFGARLEEASIQDGPPCLLEIIYSTRAKNQRAIREVRVPVPDSQRAVAEKVAITLQELL